MEGSDHGRHTGRLSSLLLERMAIACFIAVILFSGLALLRPWCAWLAIVASIMGLGLQRAAAIQRAREGRR